MRPLYAHNSSTPPLCGAPIHRLTLIKLNGAAKAIRWTLNNYSSYGSVSQMQTNFCWRSLYQRKADARLCMLLYIRLYMPLFPLNLPPCFQQPSRITRHSHPRAVRQIHTSVNFYTYSFPPGRCAMEQVISRCCYAAYTVSIQCDSQVS